MNIYGLTLLLLSWLAITVLVVFCFIRVLRK